MTKRTTVSVKPETADQLHDLKDRGESFDDVIRTLLDHAPAEAPAR